MAPPSKRRKTDTPTEVGPPLVVFKSRNKPDVCLHVFNQEYHVHSTVLKFHSEFFYKFLDSPDKEARPVDSAFTYDWVTKVDEDGSGWMLTNAGSKAGVLNHDKFSGDITHEISVFKSFLCALYDMPYALKSGKHLNTLATMAGFYCALPKVSRTLDAAIRSSLFLDRELLCSPWDFIDAALALRHELLFRDLMIVICGSGPNKTQKSAEIYDRSPDQIRDLTQTLCKRLDNKINMTLRVSLDESLSPEEEDVACQDILNCIWLEIAQILRKRSPLATFFYKLNLKASANDIDTEIRNKYRCLDSQRSIQRLLRNDLTYNPQEVAGLGYQSGNFFCNVLEDMDLPWDVDEHTW